MSDGQESMNYTKFAKQGRNQIPDVHKQPIEGSGSRIAYREQSQFDLVRHETGKSKPEGRWQKVDSRWRAVSKAFKERCQAFMDQGSSEVSHTPTEQQIFQQEKKISLSEVKARQNILQDFYKDLPPLPLELKEYPPNVLACLPNKLYDHVQLNTITQRIRRMESEGRGVNFLYIVKSRIESRLDQRREWEKQMVEKVSILKKIQREARLLQKVQPWDKSVTSFFTAVKKDIDKMYTSLIDNAVHHDANANPFFHSSQLYSCPPEFSLRVLKQSWLMDCGPACVTVLYDYHDHDENISLEHRAKEVYRYYYDKELEIQGTLIIRNNNVLRRLGASTEEFATAKELRKRLNVVKHGSEIKPIMTIVSRDQEDGSRLRHCIMIADSVVNQYGEERIPFADPYTGMSHLVAFDDFLRVSDQEYVRLV